MSPIEDLFVTKEKMIEKLVEKSQGILGIEKDKKEILFLIPKNSLTDKEMIVLYLLGKFFLKEVGLESESVVSLEELSEKTGLENQAISKRIFELRKNGIINSPDRSKYEIEYTNVDEILEDIKKKRDRNDG